MQSPSRERQRSERRRRSRSLRTVDFFGGFACLLLAVARGGTAAEQTPVRDVATSEHVPLAQAGLTCGRDCLYIWLRLQGFHASYGEIENRVPVGPRGSEMSEIVKASRTWEPSARLGKLNYRNLCAIKGPVIVHVWVTQGKDREGHYMVVTHASDKAVSLIETATQTRTTMTPQAFSSMWSSYALYKATPVMNWNIVAYSALPIAAVLLIVNGFRPNSWRIRKKPLSASSIAVVSGALLASSGCGITAPEAVSLNSTPLDGASPVQKIDPIPIAASKRHVDLGIVPFTKAGTAQFLITNLKNKPVQLQLGQPSCGCTKAVLSQDTIDPKGAVTLEISLGAEGGVYSGPRQGGVELGVKGHPGSLRFSVDGILEGIMLFPYTLRVAREAGGDSPGPLEGEITLGPSRSAETITIDELIMPARQESGLVIGQATLKPSVEINGYLRRGFEIPISVRAGLRPKPGVYLIRLTAKIGAHAVEVVNKLYVVPAMEE